MWDEQKALEYFYLVNMWARLLDHMMETDLVPKEQSWVRLLD